MARLYARYSPGLWAGTWPGDAWASPSNRSSRHRPEPQPAVTFPLRLSSAKWSNRHVHRHLVSGCLRGRPNRERPRRGIGRPEAVAVNSAPPRRGYDKAGGARQMAFSPLPVRCDAVSSRCEGPVHYAPGTSFHPPAIRYHRRLRYSASFRAVKASEPSKLNIAVADTLPSGPDPPAWWWMSRR